MLKIQERFASNYAIGVCSAIRSIVGDEAFAKLFGTENADDAIIRCVQKGKKYGEKVAQRWIRALQLS